MQSLSRTKRDTIWTKHHVNLEEGTQKCDTKRLSKLYQNQHMIENKSKQQMIDSKTHQHMKCEINRNRTKATHY